MKKTKVIIAKLLVILGLMVISLTGCGNEENSTKKETKENDIQEEQVKQEQISNNGGSFVKYNDYTYFWKISDKSRETSALYGKYDDIVNSQNTLVKIDKDGVEQEVFKGSGSGEIFIKNERIFLSKATNNSNGVVDTNRKIYSIDLNGENKVEYQDGIMKALIGDYIIFEDNAKDCICRISTIDGKIDTLKQKANVLGVINDTIYYAEADTEFKLNIGSIKDTNDNGIIATITSNDFEHSNEYAESSILLDVVDFWYESEQINFYVGYRSGTANMLQEELIVKMDKDGKNVSKNIVTANSDSDGINESEQVSKGVYKKVIKSNGQYKYNYMYVNPDTLEHSLIMSEDELNSKFGFNSGDEYNTNIYISSIVDNVVYIVVDNNIHDSANDIGWRYAYKRLKTVCFKYNIETKEFTEIYNF